MNAERYATPLPPCRAIAPLARRRKLTGEVATLAARVDKHLVDESSSPQLAPMPAGFEFRASCSRHMDVLILFLVGH